MKEKFYYTFSSVRVDAEIVGDYASHIAEAAKSARDNSEEMTAERYAWFTEEINHLMQCLGNLAYVIREVRKSAIAKEKESECETVAQ